MKKPLITALLTSIIILPISTNLTANYKNVTKEENVTRMLNQQDNSGYDWDGVQNSINTALKDKWFTSNFTSDQITNLQSTSKKQTNQLNSNNTSSKEAISSFKKQSPQFKDIYENNQDAFKNVNEKINVQFFGLQKVDLNLDASNTYDDAINNLNIGINSQYPGNNIVVSLVDDKIANNYLFDDKTLTSLSDFINNKISIKVNLQFGDNKPEVKTINLTNIKIDPKKEDAWLYESITSYFNQLNPQDLDLTATNNRNDAFNAIVNKIKDRFNINIGQNTSDTTGIQMSLVNKDVAQDNFMQKENINFVMDQNMYFDVNIADYNSSVPKVTKQHLYLSNINFNFSNMKQVINELWLNNSKANPLDLRLTSDQTYQNVINNFNQRMENLDQKDHFQIKLTDPSLANEKINKNYDPRNPDFKANVNFGFLTNGQFQSLGANDLHLSKVKLSEEDQKVKEKFNKMVTNTDRLNELAIELGIVSLASAVAALATFYDPAISAQIAYLGMISSTASLALNICLAKIQQQISTVDLISNVFAGVGLIMSSILIILDSYVALEAVDSDMIAIVGAFFSGVGILTAIPSIISDISDWIK